MSTQREILEAIQSAVASHEARPELEATIKALRDELDLAKYELEDQAKTITGLELTISDLHKDRNDLKLQLDEANFQVNRLLDEAGAATRTNRVQGHRIAELESDVGARDIMITCLRDDKESLERSLADAKSLSDRFREMLSRIMGEVKEVLPAPEVAKVTTFPVDGNDASLEPNRVTLEPMAGTNPADHEIDRPRVIWPFGG